jgi:hypothetical protein
MPGHGLFSDSGPRFALFFKVRAQLGPSRDIGREQMLKRISGLAVTLFAITLLAACSNMTQYEQQVEDFEPVYCYKSIGSVQCYKEPKYSDSRRLVNFYGPAPRTYDAPDAPDYAAPKAPKMIDYWVKDPEPVPQAAPAKDTGLKAEAAQATLAASPPESADVSFMDGLMRSIFGKPELVNKPVAVAVVPAPVPASVPVAVDLTIEPLASASPPLQPAPAAQPLIPVETGTL